MKNDYSGNMKYLSAMPSVIDDDVKNVLFHFFEKICEDYSKKVF